MTRKELLSQKVIKVVLSFLLVVSTSATCIYATEGETVSTPDTTLVEETTDSTLSEGEVTEPEETEEVVEENKEEETVEDSQEEEKEESQETEDNNQEAQESEETQDSLEEAEDTKNNDAKNAVADRSEADDALEDEIEVINEEDEEVEVYSNDISIEAPKAVLNDVTYDTLEAAVNAATSGSTITLGKGKYTLYNKGAQTKGKDLTFVGQGSDTQWGIGATVPDPSKFGTEYNGDYSFDGAGTITFNNMTLQSGSAAYLGFIRADKTVVNNCTINGQTYYWGYTSATFKNTTFNAPNYEYAIGTYSSPIMTFDTCIFNTYGKAINVYRDYAGATYVININNCTVNNTKSSSLKEWIQGTKQFLNINDTVPSGQSYVINFTGTNTVSGSKALNRDNSTCSQLYGFGNNSGNNAGHTTVNIEGVTVFTNKKLVDHELEKSVNGNTVHGSDGHRDNKYTEITKEVTLDDGTVLVETVKKCDYCGWTSDASYEYKFGGNVVISGDDVIVKDSSKDNYEVNYRATYNMSDELYNKIILSQQFINDTNTTLTFTVQLDSRLSVKKNDDGSYYYDFQSPIFYVDNNGIKVNNDNTLTVTCKLKSDWKDHLGNSASDLKMTLDGIGLLPKDSFKVGEKLSTTGRIDVHVVPNYGNPYDVPVVANVYETAMKMQYVLNYDANGGSISVTKTESDVTQETTFELTVTSEQPTRSGYTFVGWASSASATNSDIGATVALDEENYEKTIYALWQQNSTPSPTPTPRPTSTPDSGYTPCPDGMQWNEDAKVCEVIPTPTPTTTPTVVPAVVPVNPGNNDTTPTVTPEQTPEATQTPTPTPTTTPEAVEVEEEETPLVLNGHWALVNLISALVSILLAIILLVAKHEKDNDEDDETISDENQENTLTRNRRWKVVSAIVAIASVVVFVLTENMRLPMVMVDKYTLLMVVLALVNVVTLYFGKKWHEPDQENQEEM